MDLEIIDNGSLLWDITDNVIVIQRLQDRFKLSTEKVIYNLQQQFYPQVVSIFLYLRRDH